jgi:hypothetical protein
MLKSHIGALTGLVIGAAFAAILLFNPGCQPKTQSLLDPSRRVSAEELQREAADVGQELDQRAAALAEKSAKGAAEIEAATARLRAELDREAAGVEGAAAAAEEKLRAASADLQAQAERRAAFLAGVQKLSGEVVTSLASGSFNPAQHVGGVLALLAGSGMAAAAVGATAQNVTLRRKLPKPWDGTDRRGGQELTNETKPPGVNVAAGAPSGGGSAAA